MGRHRIAAGLLTGVVGLRGHCGSFGKMVLIFARDAGLARHGMSHVPPGGQVQVADPPCELVNRAQWGCRVNAEGMDCRAFRRALYRGSALMRPAQGTLGDYHRAGGSLGRDWLAPDMGGRKICASQ
jgi:hypothetical protein